MAQQPRQAVRELTVEPGQVRIAPGHLVLFNEWQGATMRSVAMRVRSVETLEGGVRKLVFDANQYTVAVGALP